MKYMKHIQTTAAPALRRRSLYPIALAYAAVVVVVTTYLLFRFDKITDLIASYAIGGGSTGLAAAIVTVTAGVFALPYLLRMRVSRLMRVTSMGAGLVAPFGWLAAAWWMELHLGRSQALLPMLVAHGSVLLAAVSVWVIGVPRPALKKHR